MGNLIEPYIFNSDGSIKTKSTNKYKDKLIESIKYNSEGSNELPRCKQTGYQSPAAQAKFAASSGELTHKRLKSK